MDALTEFQDAEVILKRLEVRSTKASKDGGGLTCGFQLMLEVPLTDDQTTQLPVIGKAMASLLAEIRESAPEDGPDTITMAIKRKLAPAHFTLTAPDGQLAAQWPGEVKGQARAKIVEGQPGLHFTVEGVATSQEIGRLAECVQRDDVTITVADPQLSLLDELDGEPEAKAPVRRRKGKAKANLEAVA